MTMQEVFILAFSFLREQQSFTMSSWAGVKFSAENWASTTCDLAQGHQRWRWEHNADLLIPTPVSWIPGHGAAATTCGDSLSNLKTVRTQQLLWALKITLNKLQFKKKSYRRTGGLLWHHSSMHKEPFISLFYTAPLNILLHKGMICKSKRITEKQ